MKTKRVELTSWVSSDDYIDIDWPRVQRLLGLDQVEWLLSLPRDRCQLVLDRIDDTSRLIAEFYDEQTLLTYHLMWS